MTLDEILKKLKQKKKGTYFWIDVQTNKTKYMTAQARRDGHTCYKFTHMQVRHGVNYENMQAIKDMRAAGKPKGERAWGEYSPDPEHLGVVILHKGKVYINFKPLDPNENAINAKKITYFVDGVEMTLDEVRATGYFTDSEINSHVVDQNPKTVDVLVDSIVNIY